MTHRTTQRRRSHRRHTERGYSSFFPTRAPALSKILFRLLGFILIFGGSAVCFGLWVAAIWLGPGLALKGAVLFVAFFAAGYCCFSDWLQQ